MSKKHKLAEAAAEPPTSQKKKKKHKHRPPCGDSAPGGSSGTAGSLPPHKYILAPMVGGSELAFRLLCRKYAADELLCYTPMMSSERFVAEPAYREEAFTTCAADRPLVAHFSGNKPDVLLAAAKLVESRIDAFDLNLGCPQRVAHAGHFGSFLLDEEDRPLVLSIVRTLAAGLSIPVFVKIRLLATSEKTIELCTQLRDAGAKLIAIHARHRVNLVDRSGPGARDGPALLGEVVKVRAALGNSVRLVSNGNVRCWEDARDNLASTGADGIMCAEAYLDDPALFFPTIQGAATGGGSGGGGGGGGGMGGGEGGAANPAKEVRRLSKKLRETERLVGRPESSLSSEEREKLVRMPELQKALKRAKKAEKKAKSAAEAEATEGGGQPAAAPTPAAAPRRAPARKPGAVALALEYLTLAEEQRVSMK